MRTRFRWPAAAVALTLSLYLVLGAPVPARAQTCEVLSTLGACSPSEPQLEFNPDGTITLPGGGGSAPTPPPPPSSPTLRPDAARMLLDLANEERARVGAPTLVTRDDVVRMAEDHTRKMLGSDGGIFHNLDLLTKPLRNTLGALTVGENVGYSTHVEDLHPRFMASPPHRAALLDPRFTVAGFAVIQDTDGLYYATQDFIQPSGAAPAPAPAPAPPAPAPPPLPPPPADVDAQVRAPAPAEPVAPETVVDRAPEAPEVNAVPVETPTTLGTLVRRGDAPELAQGGVAGLGSGVAVATPSSSGPPVVLALVLLAAAVLGQGWWWARARMRR